MNTEQVKQIVETIKTLNLNVDSQTLENIISQITPLLWFKLIVLPILEQIIVGGVVITLGILVYKVAIKDNN